jgi:cell division protein FtsB
VIMKSRKLIIIVVTSFLLGVIACHLYYYSNSYFTEKKLKKEIERLKKESSDTRQELERIDSILNVTHL